MDHSSTPDWNLVTDEYKEPGNFQELLSLLMPKAPHGDHIQRLLLGKREKEFYQKENLIPFIYFGMEKMRNLPKFHKAELLTILRIIRLCQEVEMYEAGYQLFHEQQLFHFVSGAAVQEEWDTLTHVIAWHYLILKGKLSQLNQEDALIWSKIKHKDEWMREYKAYICHKKVIDFHIRYLGRHAQHMDRYMLEEDLMHLAMHCNTYILDVYEYDLYRSLSVLVRAVSPYVFNENVLICQRLILAQLAALLDLQNNWDAEDFVMEMRELLRHVDYSFYYRYEPFIGTLISYIPFFEMIQVSMHAYYIEEILQIGKEEPYKDDLLRTYMFSQLPSAFLEFVKPLLRNKQYHVIHDILFYWCTEEQRTFLENMYNLEIVYERYASG